MWRGKKMKRLLALALALVATLAVGTVALAANPEIYVEMGYGAEQQYYGSLLSGWDVTPAAIGGKFESGSFVVGVDYIRRGLASGGLELDRMEASPFFEGTITTGDVYGGVRLLGKGGFKLYGLLGYITNETAVDVDSDLLCVGTRIRADGVGVGLAGELVIGPVVLDARAMTTLYGRAEETLFLGPFSLVQFYDEGSVTLAQARCTLKLGDHLGVYAAYHYIDTAAIENGDRISIGQATWYAAGLNIYF